MAPLVKDKESSYPLMEKPIAGFGPFALSHPDLTMDTIMVSTNSPSEITGIIDWETPSTGAAWENARTPAFMLNQRSPDEEQEDLEGQEKGSTERKLLDDFLEAGERILPGVSKEQHRLAEQLAPLEEAAQIMITNIRCASRGLDSIFNIVTGWAEHTTAREVGGALRHHTAEYM